MNWVIIIFSLVIGFSSLFYGIKLFRLYLKIKSWTKTHAKVISKSVQLKRLAQSGRASKIVVIEYQYEVDSQMYQSNRVFLVEFLKGEKGFLQSSAEKFLLTIGNEITVYVDPKDPKESVIYCDGLLMYLFVMAFGSITLLIGIFKFFSAILP